MSLAPIAVHLGAAVITHGERGHDLDPANPEACLCGEPEYLSCPGWLFGDGTVGGLTLTPVVQGLWRTDADEDWPTDP